MVTGEVVAADGARVADAELTLVHARGAFCSRPVSRRTLRADGSGRYAAALDADEVSASQQLFDHCVSLSFERGGLRASAFLHLLGHDGGAGPFAGPTIQEWTGAPIAQATAFGPRLVFDDSLLPSPEHPSDGARVMIRTPDGGVVWDSGGVPAPTLSLSQAALEDFAAPSAEAWVFRLGRRTGEVFWDGTWQAPGPALDAGADAPPSRGAACSFADGGPPCPLTDGALSETGLRLAPEVVFSWPQPRVFSAAAVRALSFVPSASLNPDERVVIDGAVDGGAADAGEWTELGARRAGSAYLWLPLAPLPAARLRLRVVGADGGSCALLGASEVSFY